MATLKAEFHGKRLSDFDLRRILQAQEQGFYKPVTAYLCHAFISNTVCAGVVFGHVRKDPIGRLADGHWIGTSLILKAQREGRFWVITTLNSRYVLATFHREFGRSSLRQLLGPEKDQTHASPRWLQ